MAFDFEVSPSKADTFRKTPQWGSVASFNSLGHGFTAHKDSSSLILPKRLASGFRDALNNESNFYGSFDAIRPEPLCDCIRIRLGGCDELEFAHSLSYLSRSLFAHRLGEESFCQLSAERLAHCMRHPQNSSKAIIVRLWSAKLGDSYKTLTGISQRIFQEVHAIYQDRKADGHKDAWTPPIFLGQPASSNNYRLVLTITHVNRLPTGEQQDPNIWVIKVRL